MKLSLLTKTEIVASQADVPVPMDIRPLIYEIRGQQVILDRDLAMLYGVPTKALNQAVKRNAERFLDRFMFRLSESEMDELVTNCDRFKMMKHSNGELAESDFEAFARQCGNFTKTICGICHDHFIIADQKEIYWSGASLKDAGRLTFAAAKLGAEMIPGLLASIRKATSATNSCKKGGCK